LLSIEAIWRSVEFSREGFNVVEKMLEELAGEAKEKANFDLLETFKEIRKILT
jgi:hypothetical protein